MKSRRRICWFVLLLFVCIQMTANTAKVPFYYFRTHDTRAGLSHNTVNVILQDRQGFMWIGTKDGLNKYDGVSFRVFRKENSALGNNLITALHEDLNGNIWVGTDAGVYIYNPKTEEFTNICSISSTSGKEFNYTVTCIRSDLQGRIWISFENKGLFCYDGLHNSLPTCMLSTDKDCANITHFWFNKEQIWVGRYEDNLYVSDSGASFKVFKGSNGVEPFKGKVINAFVQGLYNCIYVATSDGLWEINLILCKSRKLLDGYVRSVCFREDTELWVGTEQGIYIYDLKENTYTHLTTTETTDPYGLSDNAIYALYKDREGGIWIGSYFGGLNYYPYPYTYFEKYYPHGSMLHMGRRVREFCAGKNGTIWIGTEDKGLFHFDPSTGLLVPFQHSKLYHNIHGLCLDNDYLWIGTFSGGLNRLNLRTHELKHYEKGDAPNTLNADNIFSICKSSTNDIWIGTTSGLLRYNRATDDFSRIEYMRNIFVYDILEDSEGRLWLATYSEGVYCYDILHGKWKKYSCQLNDSTSLPYNKVVSIFEDSHKRLWFMTQGAGFCRYNPQTDNFVRYDMSDGFPSNIVYKMLEDDNGTLWISTSRGLVSFQPETEIKRIYTTTNGLLDNSFNYQSGYKDGQGKLYFGSINGFIAFNPVNFTDNKQTAPLVLSDFFLSNKRLPIAGKCSPLSKSITFTDAITLDAHQNSFSLRAVVLSYQASLSNTVIYRLDGFDKEWNTARENDFCISYSNLPYGDYTLRVRGANSDKVWNPQERILQITIRPPFYLSWQAYILYVCILTLFIVLLVCYFRRRNARKQALAMEKLEYEKERELYTAKINFFTDVAHEIRTPLTLITNPLKNIRAANQMNDSVKEDLEIIDLNANRLLDLVNQLLDFRKTEIKGFRLNFMVYNLSDLLHQIYIQFTSLAHEKGLKFSMDIDKDFYAAVDKEGFTKIVSNLFNNAVKYAETYIHVSLKRQSDGKFLTLTIINDGEIIPLAMRKEIFKPFIQYRGGKKHQIPGTGIGLALARSLAELHGGTLVMDTAIDRNCFILTLPIYQEKVLHLSEKELDQKIDCTDEPTGHATIMHYRYTLLIVEDNVEMRKFLQKQLSTIYQVLVASDGVEALNVLHDSTVNLIVSDVMMPKMDGLELCDRVKSELDYSHIPIILLTAKTTLQSRIDGLNAGADAYVEKPFSMDYLKVCIANLLKNREQLQNTFLHAPFVSTNAVAISKADEDFLKKLNALVQSNMQNSEFSSIDLAEQMCMSRSSLNRKIKGILDITPNDYIRIERLKKAAQLLREGTCKINEVCYMVGFNTPSYFTKCFQKQFGMLPKDMIIHK